ncbi:hypothetical protein RRG08_063810 [Elysia crispata]|uniref:Uncharacterized protein n=1 Tax=Elysia crispata TaxID=231223 RepID=A0AAE0XNC8_9GAST|nr:hypothetical protein RRG08_063810 [Elysia crispata]
MQPRLSLVVLVACDITAVTVRAKFAYVLLFIVLARRRKSHLVSSLGLLNPLWSAPAEGLVQSCYKMDANKLQPSGGSGEGGVQCKSARAGANQVVRHTRVCLSGGDESTAPITDLTLSGNTQQPVMQ